MEEALPEVVFDVSFWSKMQKKKLEELKLCEEFFPLYGTFFLNHLQENWNAKLSFDENSVPALGLLGEEEGEERIREIGRGGDTERDMREMKIGETRMGDMGLEGEEGETYGDTGEREEEVGDGRIVIKGWGKLMNSLTSLEEAAKSLMSELENGPTRNLMNEKKKIVTFFLMAYIDMKKSEFYYLMCFPHQNYSSRETGYDIRVSQLEKGDILQQVHMEKWRQELKKHWHHILLLYSPKDQSLLPFSSKKLASLLSPPSSPSPLPSPPLPPTQPILVLVDFFNHGLQKLSLLLTILLKETLPLSLFSLPSLPSPSSTPPSLPSVELWLLQGGLQKNLSFSPIRLLLSLTSLPSVSPSLPSPSLSSPRLHWLLDRTQSKPQYLHVSRLQSFLSCELLQREAIYLNLKLMQWRILPDLNLTEIYKDKTLMLIGMGTLGCLLARTFLSYGIKNIILIDNGIVHYSNVSRQNLFILEDANLGRRKVDAARDGITKIRADCDLEAHFFDVPSLGDATCSHRSRLKEDIKFLDTCIKKADIIFFATDSRESRWLPTVLSFIKYWTNKLWHQKLDRTYTSTVAIGFDSFLVLRNIFDDVLLFSPPASVFFPPISPPRLPSNAMGSPKSPTSLCSPSLPSPLPETVKFRSACYFCSSLHVAKMHQKFEIPMDLQCTVTRPGVASIAVSIAAELYANCSQRRDLSLPISLCPVSNEENKKTRQKKISTILGACPSIVRGSLSDFSTSKEVVPAQSHCIACSPSLLSHLLPQLTSPASPLSPSSPPPFIPSSSIITSPSKSNESWTEESIQDYYLDRLVEILKNPSLLGGITGMDKMKLEMEKNIQEYEKEEKLSEESDSDMCIL